MLGALLLARALGRRGDASRALGLSLLLMALASFLGAWLSSALGFPDPPIELLWIPASLILAGCLARGSVCAVSGSVGLLGWALFSGMSAYESMLLVLGSAASPALTAALIRQWGERRQNGSNLVIATRMIGTAFKRCLAGLPAGSPVDIEGPYGDLTLDGDTRPAVFLAGGIGITPFRSMIVDAAARGLSRDLTLFYSNRSADDAAFLSELEQLAQQNPRFRLVATMTEAPDWQGEQGFITRDMIERHAGDIARPIFYIAGPPAMVAAMERLLREAGVSVENTRAEEFGGY